ncbi:MAG TPA: ABC transporter [Microscillaceae bacterium]|nr:ABC transporter [Microscillaceae bacterium]
MKFFLYLRLMLESFSFALQALRSNILRTTLSLLGVSIGIFAIITVFTIVDALERKIRDDMSFIGDNVMYIQKFPWQFGGGAYPWWRYFRRPSNTVAEFRYLEKNLETSQAVALIAGRGGNTIKYRSNSITAVQVMGVSYGYSNVSDIPVGNGRYFSRQEVDRASSVVLIGATVAESLFPKQSPLNKKIKIRGRPVQVIGVLEKEGSNIFGGASRDEQVLIPYGTFGKFFLVGRKGIEPTIALKGKQNDAGLLELESEVRGLLRSKRGLRPFDDDNFALNRTEAFADQVTKLFGVLHVAGWIIGGFSILVGAFGIANIMFVSVKERTNIIGIQKSLGAKTQFILFQFLFEAVFLGLIGGGVGLFLVNLVTFIPLGSIEMILSANNIILGILVSSIVGTVAGIIPAFIAARLDPVIAIRAA